MLGGGEEPPRLSPASPSGSTELTSDQAPGMTLLPRPPGEEPRAQGRRQPCSHAHPAETSPKTEASLRLETKQDSKLGRIPVCLIPSPGLVLSSFPTFFR